MPRKGQDKVPLLDYADWSDSEEDNLFVNFNDHDELLSRKRPTRKRHGRKRRSHKPSACSIFLLISVLVITSAVLIITAVYMTGGLKLFMSVMYLLSAGMVPKTTFTADWVTDLPDLGSQSPLRAVHVNNDGVLDLIVGVLGPVRSMDGSAPDYCSPPKPGCEGGIIAFDGKDGSVLWKTPTRHSVFELKCPGVDADGDGVSDCFGSGRKGTLVALNPRDGSVIWTDPDVINPRWSVFAPAFIQDIDGDGVRDMVLANGGDSDYSAEEHNRTANELLILSTATGQMIGDGKLSTPDGRETYCLPVIYEQLDGSQYILFGSGGETVSGSLYMISLRDMLSHVSPGVDYNLTGGYSHWEWMDKNSQGVITLYQSKEKGFMLSPVLADLNLDGDDDIIALSHDGLLLVLSGTDMTLLWSPLNFTKGTSTETYTLPAVGHFNDDKYPDLMVTWQTGVQPTYFTQMTYVLDGLDGSILWYKQSPANAYTNMALLTLSTTQKNRDAFFFSMSSSTVAGDSAMLSCNETELTTMDYLIMDRSVMKSPLLVYSEKAAPHYYNVTSDVRQKSRQRRAIIAGGEEFENGGLPEDFEDWNNETLKSDDTKPVTTTTTTSSSSNTSTSTTSTPITSTTAERCTMLKPSALSTAIIEDLDGDGKLELAFLQTSVAVVPAEESGSGQPAESMFRGSLRKYSLGRSLHALPRLVFNEVLINTPSNESASLPEVPLSADTHQRWSQRQGKGQDGAY